MSTPHVAAFAAGTAELNHLATNLAKAEQALIKALTTLTEAETRLHQILTDDGDSAAALTALDAMDKAAARVDQLESDLDAILTLAKQTVASGYG